MCPRLPNGDRPQGELELRVKYCGAFADFLGDVVSAYTIKPLKGTSASFKFVKPSTAG
jgi:hypothetical protein